jgi:hypothetical protein
LCLRIVRQAEDHGRLARLHEHPDAGRSRLVEDAAEERDEPVDGCVGPGFVAGIRLVRLCDVLQ